MPDIVWSVAGFIVAMSVLVCFHEFGHYWVARRMGVKVLRFSLGWGKPFKTFVTRDGVEWSIAPLPIGGYVKMLDEREGPVAAHERHLAFNNQSVAKRMAIVSAGPIFNFALAIALYWLVFVIGVQGMKPVIAAPAAGSVAAAAGLHEGDEVVAVDGEAMQTWAVLGTRLIDGVLDGGKLQLSVQARGGMPREVLLDVSKVRVDPEVLFDDLGLTPYEPTAPPVLTALEKGMPAEAAGLQQGDRVLSMNGDAIRSPSQLVSWVRAHPGAIVEIEIERNGQRSTRSLVLSSAQTEGKAYGRLGSGVATPPDLWQDLRAERRLDVFAAVPAAAEQTWRMSWLTLRMLGRW